MAALDYYFSQTTDRAIGIQIKMQRETPNQLAIKPRITGKQLCDLMNMATGTLSDVENGKIRLDINAVLTFSYYLDCNPFILLDATSDDSKYFYLVSPNMLEQELYKGYKIYERLKDGRVIIYSPDRDPFKPLGRRASLRLQTECMLQELLWHDLEFFELLLRVQNAQDTYPDRYRDVKNYIEYTAKIIELDQDAHKQIIQIDESRLKNNEAPTDTINDIVVSP